MCTYTLSQLGEGGEESEGGGESEGGRKHCTFPKMRGNWDNKTKTCGAGCIQLIRASARPFRFSLMNAVLIENCQDLVTASLCLEKKSRCSNRHMGTRETLKDTRRAPLFFRCGLRENTGSLCAVAGDR